MNKTNKKGLLFVYLNWPFVMAACFLIGTIVISIINENAGKVAGLITIISIAFSIYLRNYKYNNLYIAIEKAMINGGRFHGTLLENLSVPITALSTEGRILWANNSFFDISKALSTGKNIKDVFPDINKEFLAFTGDKKEHYVSCDDNKYRAEFSVLNFDKIEAKDMPKVFYDGEKIILVSLYDATEAFNLRKDLDNNKQVTGYIYIDNYYEVTENMEDSKASMMIAMLDRKLTRYISYNSGILKKLEKDKYFFVTTKRDIIDMMDDKFSILESTKELLGSDNIPLTISIGIGYEGKSLESNQDLARLAIDMALSRGGDQVVVKAGTETIFFGGKSASTASSARVRARVKAATFRETLDTKDKIIVMGHKNGDLDSFGACIGVYIMAKQLSKDVRIITNSLTKDTEEMKKKFMDSDSFDKNIFATGDEALNFADENTLLVIVDHTRPVLSDEERIYDKKLDMVIFDHHRIAEDSLNNEAILSYIDASASSTCELVTEVMTYFTERLKFRSIEADTMLGGIMVDTKNFSYQTNSKTFDAASYLKKKGADTDRVRKLLRVDMNFEMAKNEIISKVEFYKDKYAIAVIDKDYGIENNVAKAEIANELVNIKGVGASIVIAKDNEKYTISARSIDEVNVQVLLEKLGGGGHRNLAGGSIEVESFEDAVNKIKETIDLVYEEK